jgi:hypothetical protein
VVVLSGTSFGVFIPDQGCNGDIVSRFVGSRNQDAAGWGRPLNARHAIPLEGGRGEAESPWAAEPNSDFSFELGNSFIVHCRLRGRCVAHIPEFDESVGFLFWTVPNLTDFPELLKHTLNSFVGNTGSQFEQCKRTIVRGKFRVFDLVRGAESDETAPTIEDEVSGSKQMGTSEVVEFHGSTAGSEIDVDASRLAEATHRRFEFPGSRLGVDVRNEHETALNFIRIMSNLKHSLLSSSMHVKEIGIDPIAGR